jgi:hypothetical protein
MPGRIMMIERIPRNANGKVDRAALPDPGHPRGDGQLGRVPPRTRTEHAVAEIWSEVLRRPIAELGVHDAFFNLGGNSLLLAQVQRRLSSAFANASLFANTEIQVVHLFEHQTIALMSRLVDGGRPDPALNLDRISQRLSSNRMARRSSHE